jgi:hypothetical protein
MPEVGALDAKLWGETGRLGQAEGSHAIDAPVPREAPALFLCAPQALCAVHTPYRTTSELAVTTVGAGRWSRRRPR